MALEFAHGAIQWLGTDAAGTTYTVSGLSFQPKALRFYWQGLQSAVDATSTTTHQRAGIGFAVSTSARRCTAVQDQDAALAMTCTTSAWTDCVAATVTSTPARDGALDLDAINSDGFRLIVDDQAPVGITVFWEAWGGSDITNAAVGDIAEPAATGNQSYTSPGFTPNIVMMSGVQATSMDAAARGDSGLSVSAMSGTTTPLQFVLVNNNDDGSAASDCDRYYRQEGHAMIAVAGGNPDARANLNAFLSNGFELNWSARATTNRRTIFLCIAGGTWQARSDTWTTTAVGTTLTISGLPFAPKGVSMTTPPSTLSAAGTADAGEQASWGSASSTSSRRCMAYGLPNGTATSEVNLRMEYDEIAASALLSPLIDVDAFLPDGIRYIVDGTLAASATISSLLFGDAPNVFSPLYSRRPYTVRI